MNPAAVAHRAIALHAVISTCVSDWPSLDSKLVQRLIDCRIGCASGLVDLYSEQLFDAQRLQGLLASTICSNCEATAAAYCLRRVRGQVQTVH